MRVAFISRATLFSMPGGDTRQMVKTAEELRNMDVVVDIFTAGNNVDLSGYDLLHFFNIIRPADIMPYVIASGKPFVISPIYVEYGTINEQGKGFFFKKLSNILGADALSYVKSVARWILNGEKIRSYKYLVLGHRNSVKWIAKRAACFLPNSNSEMKRFGRAYNLNCNFHVVPNGIDSSMMGKAILPNSEYDGAVICIARFEPLKNQLSLIRALNGTSYKVFLHGKPAPNHAAYYKECIDAAGDNIQIRDWLEGDELYSVYAAAKVHVLPTYFETTGLVSLEAAFMGCNVVVTKRGDQEEYFKEDAWYCNPEDVASIKAALDAAYAAPYNPAFRERILKNYTWKRAAEETLKAYKKVLKL